VEFWYQLLPIAINCRKTNSHFATL
jgi:hypothetical protein